MVSNKKREIAFLSTYPPRECGLATFTQDLIRELDNMKSISTPKVIAVSDEKYDYGKRVIFEIDQYDRKSYVETAEKINNSNIELLVIEHEYGIFGGKYGEYIIDLIDNLNIPFITTLHTVLPKPARKQRIILRALAKKGDKLITMGRNTIEILKDVYEVDKRKIEMIHHGVPYRVLESRDKLKERSGFKDVNVISTFGLLSPGKGIEYAIEAVSKIYKDRKDLIYLILGQTHPAVKKQTGESYREKLMNLAESLGVKDSVKFVDKYLTKEEIINYLQMSDIYMTPYLGKDQAVSGTLAYAVGYGKVIISTPYSYAREMLADGRGLLAEFKDSDSLADCIRFVLGNPDKKREIEAKTKDLGRTMMWDNIAAQYTKLFVDTIEETLKTGGMVI